MADLGLRGRRLRETLRVLRVDLEVRVVARVAERRIDVVPYGIHRGALPDAGGCGKVLAGTELPRNHSRRGVGRISQALAPREHRLGVLDAVHNRYVHGPPLACSELPARLTRAVRSRWPWRPRRRAPSRAPRRTAAAACGAPPARSSRRAASRTHPACR